MNYMTSQEKARLEEQLRKLIDRRVELSDRIGRARKHGDLKENAEYHTAKEDQGHDERKIRDLQAKLATAVVVDDTNVPAGMVFIGATVRLRDVDTGDEDLYRLVGETSGDVYASDVTGILQRPGRPLRALDRGDLLARTRWHDARRGPDSKAEGEESASGPRLAALADSGPVGQILARTRRIRPQLP